MRAIVSVISLVVVGLPMVLASLWALGMQDRVESLMGGERTVPTGLANAGRAVNDWVADAQEGRLAAILFDPVAISDHRSVEWERTGVTVADVLLPGEAAPDPVHARLWLAARGLTLAQTQGCPAVLDTIATRCSAGMLEVAPQKDGTFTVSARLGYAPADAPGPVPAQGRGVAIDDTYLRLPAEGGLQVARDQVGAAEREILSAAQDACRTLREAGGTCVIRSVAFDRRAGRGDQVNLTASVTLSSLVPDGSAGAAGATEAAIAGGIMERLRGMMAPAGGDAAPASGAGGAPRVLQGGSARNGENTFSVD
jgi:hypothetical protein